jgi:light-regulated signal transduction histidine kinase (bacteriophytochrome)
LGKERIILLSIEDITERREIENGLKKAHEELEAFAYSVSHDLRAPLRGIDGWSLALLEDYKDKLDEQGRQYIDLVRSETQIMGRLIDDLLTFSQQSRSEMNQQQLDMTAVAQAIASRLQ